MAEPREGIPLVEIEDILPILSKIAIFGGLDDKQLYTIFRLLRKVTYKKGEFIFEEGDAPSNIYIVWQGNIELVLDVSGTPLAEAVFTVGYCFGDTAVIGIQRHTASAIATEDTELIVLPRDALFSLWETDTKLFSMLILNIAREACRRLNKTDKILLQYFAHKS